ncbi:RNA polymerase sigma factor [Thalassotalea sp. PS06]|uniref:RNA polymerase sigma factor n=1 Tax=Thalassotalea sp. PS06 TaxID=2594005 RepID=UPI0011643403|nr:RNA polymerase sigma factor [Thalassotalea sp. PS06]QDP00455.1 RNA polymerase sigma factor [Thalassotalea sp. PS06]
MLKDWLQQFRRQGDSQSFAQVVSQCQTQLQGYCRRLTAGDFDMADDIAQETLISVYQQFGQLQNLDAFKSWLYRIAYRHFLRLQQTEKRWQCLEEDELEVLLQGEQVGDSNNPCLDERYIMQLMALLNSEERAVITLNHTLGYSQPQIAALLDMPLGTVKSHGKRGKDKLIAFSLRQQRGAA